MSMIYIYTHDKSRVSKAEDFHISVFSLRCDYVTMGLQSCPFSCYSKWDPRIRSIKHYMVAVTNEDSWDAL